MYRSISVNLAVLAGGDAGVARGPGAVAPFVDGDRDHASPEAPSKSST
jgi:hypothetical protein